jgi:competence protein ComEC
LTSVLVMPAGMLALGLMPFGLDGPPLWLAGLGVDAILAVARQVAALPGAAPVLPPLPGWALALAALGFCWLTLWRGPLAWLGLPLLAGALLAGSVARPPDVIVSADGRLVLMRGGEGAWLHRAAGATGFARDGMLRAMGLQEAGPLPAEGEAPGLRCTPASCSLVLASGEVALLRPARPREAPDPALRAATCGRAALVVSPEPLRAPCPGSAVVDRFSVWRDGAHAAWLEPGGVKLVSDRAWRGARPWVPPLPMPGRPDPSPLAPVDTGGQGALPS